MKRLIIYWSCLGGAIEIGAQKITNVLDKMNSVIAQQVHKPIGDSEQIITEFSPYRLVRWKQN